MKLEDKFFKACFYPFLIGIIMSIIIVSFLLFYYSNGFLDKKTASNIYNIEKKYATVNINSINILLSNLLLKVQVGLQEQITFYQNIASNITDENKENNTINDYVFNVKYLLDNHMENSEKVEYLSLWFLDNKKTKFENTKEEKMSNLYQQIAIYSQLTQSLYSVYNSMDDILLSIYFLFEDTGVFISYPFKYWYKDGILPDFLNYKNNPPWCTDEKGNLINYYKFHCRDFYKNMMRSKEDLFDLNVKDTPDKKIFITPVYKQLSEANTEEIFTLCILFDDSISKKGAYICADVVGNNLFDSFDSFNERLIGYFSVVAIGYSDTFYFPQMSTSGEGKTLGEYIFRWDKDYYLEEKLDFMDVIQKLITSNYYKKITGFQINNNPINIFNEVFIDDSNGEEQYFYLNKVKYNYCIFPIVLENLDKKIEHVLSIVYIFNKKLYYQHMLSYQSKVNDKLIFQCFILIFFGIIVLYLIVLSFGLLAKFIVIPIKNVQYMLEGINVGGEYRLNFLEDLHKKQEENLEKVNKINRQLMIKNSSEKIKKKKNSSFSNEEKEKEKHLSQRISLKEEVKLDKIKENKDKDNKEIIDEENKSKNNSIQEKKSFKKLNSNIIKTLREDEKLLNISTDIMEEDSIDMNLEYNGELINPKINYDKKYDLESNVIEKELNFYDFDEELLQYRPVEIDRLVQSLLNLKSALILTSSDHEVENIIDYSKSEFIFNNFKNKEGSRLCQSNIGNLQSQLLKYDKAIYHLALSLQNVELKKFLSLTLSDELDESDSLLHKIEMNYSKSGKEKELNKLAKKQQNAQHKNFSQKIIGILINSRYNKLINIYFKFFSYIQKTDYNYDKLSGWFMHTSFHTIHYYHKILIQYIYLCFVSNDLVKIGESILDYIEFLIKFKLKTTKDKKYILYVFNKDVPGIKEKQEIKKKYFDKIINWFNLFDNYEKQINENSALGNYKDVIDAYTHNLTSNHNEFDSGNQSALLFQINLQRCDFLKGKFALVCKNYSDALGYLINAAKKKRIVVDGLIKKRALKHISKIAEKVKKTIINKNYSNYDFNQVFLGTNNTRSQNKSIILNDNNISEDKKDENEEKEKSLKFIEMIGKIKEKVNNDINECNEKQLKDILIIIDCNLSNKAAIDSYVDVTKTILKNYLTNNDRIGVFMLMTEYRIICPMMCKSEVDMLNFHKDLDTYSEKSVKREVQNSFFGNEIIQEKLGDNESETYKNSRSSNNFSMEDDFKECISNNDIIIEDTIKSLNYCLNYLKMKEIDTNEKFFIYFISNVRKFMEYLNEIKDFKNFQNLSYESGEKKTIDLQKNKKIHFLLVGKIDEENESENYKRILLQYFGSKSEIIPHDNMKKIKTILSANSIINDNITFPNEIYK